MLYPAVLGLGGDPQYQEIRALIDIASELFSDEKVSPESILGLWGELFLLSKADDVRNGFEFWRVKDTERYDFSDGNVRLEVKTTLRDSRRHIFSLEQLRPVDGVVVYVASLMLQPSSGGLTILDLIERISTMLDPMRYRLLLSRVRSTLRGIIHDESSQAFDERKAELSLRFFDATAIPCVAPNIPQEVSGVHFHVDLTNVSSMSNFVGKEKLLITFSNSCSKNLGLDCPS
jgi:hypothetical protein